MYHFLIKDATMFCQITLEN